MYDDVPEIMREFLQYMISIKNRSINTVNEYYYDLRYAFRFLKLYKNAYNKTRKGVNEN